MSSPSSWSSANCRSSVGAPHAEDRSDKLEQKIINEDVPLEKLDKCSPHFVQFIKRLLDKNPETRPSIQDVLREDWLKEEEAK